MTASADIRGMVHSAPRDNGYGDKVGSAHRALALLYGLLAVGFFGIALLSSEDASPWIALIIAVPAALHGAIALGAFKRQGWSRGASIVVGVLMLPGFPIGTLIGIYLIRYASASWQE